MSNLITSSVIDTLMQAATQQQAVDALTSDPSVVIDARVQSLRGTAAQLDLVTLAAGEIAVELTSGAPNKTLRLGDGATPGGVVAGPGAVQLVGADDTLNTAPAIIADSLETGTAVGDARGSGAIDLQRKRGQSNRIAAASDSIILGGRDNAVGADGIGSEVSGSSNVCRASTSVVKGLTNQLLSGESTLVFGRDHKIPKAQYSLISGVSASDSADGSLIIGQGACFSRANVNQWQLTRTGSYAGTLVGAYGDADPTQDFAAGDFVALFGLDLYDPAGDIVRANIWQIQTINSSGDVTFYTGNPIPNPGYSYSILGCAAVPSMILRSQSAGNQDGSIRVAQIRTANATPTLLSAIPFATRSVFEIDVRVQAVRAGEGTFSVASYWRRLLFIVAADATGTIKVTQTPAADYEDVAGWNIGVTANNTTKTFDITVTGDTDSDGVIWSATVEFRTIHRLSI